MNKEPWPSQALSARDLLEGIFGMSVKNINSFCVACSVLWPRPFLTTSPQNRRRASEKKSSAWQEGNQGLEPSFSRPSLTLIQYLKHTVET